MTISEFRDLNPSSQNILLFHTGSTVLAINVSTKTCDGLNVAESLSELDNVYLQINGDQYKVPVNSTIVKPGYYSLVISPFTVSSTSDITTCTLTYLFPSPTEVGFSNSDYNAVFGNATDIRTVDNQVFKVDRRSSLASPSNLDAILSGSAVLAEIQDSNYNQKSYTGIRYEGVKLTSGSLYFDDPALQFRSFKGSIYPYNTGYDIIVSASYSSENTTTLWFNPTTQNSTETSPPSGRPIYEEIDNRFVRIKNRKVYDVDGNIVYLLGYDQIGQTEQPLPPIPSGSEFSCNCYEIYLREGYYGEIRSGWVNFIDCSGSAQYRTFNTNGGVEYFYVSAQQITSYSADGVSLVPSGSCSSGTLN